jgi:hypothetical protein
MRVRLIYMDSVSVATAIGAIVSCRWVAKSGSEANDQGLVEVVVAEVDVEAVADLLQTLTELTSTPSLKL